MCFLLVVVFVLLCFVLGPVSHNPFCLLLCKLTDRSLCLETSLSPSGSLINELNKSSKHAHYVFVRVMFHKL